jgi:cholesterol oxidase
VSWPGTQGGLSTTAGVRENRGAGDGWVMPLPTKKVLRAANCGWPGASAMPSTGATQASLSLNTTPDDRGWGRSVSITSSVHPTEDSHVEAVTYGSGGNAMGLMFTLLTGDGTRITRPLKLLAQIFRHPIRFVRVTNPRGWSQRSLITGVMQTTDTSLSLVPKLRILDRRLRLTTRQDPDHPTPTFLPVANDFARRLADRTGGTAQSWLTEALFNMPITAHILGGAIAADTPEHGVVAGEHRVFGYQNLLICDGAVIPANPGVNPSLTITAMAERAMAAIPLKPGAQTTTPRAAFIPPKPAAV